MKDDGTSSETEQWAVLAEAHTVFVQRSASYGEVWRQYGALANLLQAARKVDRLMELWWHNPDGAAALQKDALDDAIDAMNYLVFFMRLAREGNMTGSAPDRPQGMSLQEHLEEAGRLRPSHLPHGEEVCEHTGGAHVFNIVQGVNEDGSYRRYCLRCGKEKS